MVKRAVREKTPAPLMPFTMLYGDFEGSTDNNSSLLPSALVSSMQPIVQYEGV